jgi:hypothetical protein
LGSSNSLDESQLRSVWRHRAVDSKRLLCQESLPKTFWPSERPTPKDFTFFLSNKKTQLGSSNSLNESQLRSVWRHRAVDSKRLLCQESLPKISWPSEQPTPQDFTFYTLIF